MAQPAWRLRLQPQLLPRAPLRSHRPARPAAQGVYAWQERRRALLDSVLSAPARVESYFAASPLRRCAWGAVAYGGGYYAGNVVTLSFGALAINDVLAAALTVAFYEVVTTLFYEAPRRTLRLWFANLFKIGVVTGMLADALKLGS